MRQFIRRKIALTLGLMGLVLVTACAVVASHRLPLFTPTLAGASPECQSIARRLEAVHYDELVSLTCSFGEPKPIANSSLTARKYTYDIRTHGSQCDGIDPGFDATCYTRGGLITSDNQLYPGLDTVSSFMPSQYDYCATEELQLWGQRSVAPTANDLYTYQGKLYQRYTYINATLDLPYGKCIFNGTALINGDPYVVTNVAVSYIPAKSGDFLTNCKETTLHESTASWSECVYYMAAASERIDICANDYLQMPTYAPDGSSITGFRDLGDVYHIDGVNGTCREAYLQRMAALRKCSVISDRDLQKTCSIYVSQPEDGYNPYKIHRVFTPL